MEESPAGERERPHRTAPGPTHLPVSLHSKAWGQPRSSFS